MLIKWEFYQQAGFKALEGYITRRNSFSGKGTTGELNIWTGTTPPEDEVGVFVNSEIDDPIKYIDAVEDRLVTVHVTDVTKEETTALPGKGRYDFEKLFKERRPC